MLYGGRGYGRPCDVWSLGILTYLVLCGKVPYDHEEVDDPVPEFSLEVLMAEDALWGHVDRHAQETVQLLLVKEPEERLSAELLLATPWLAGIDT